MRNAVVSVHIEAHVLLRKFGVSPLVNVVQKNSSYMHDEGTNEKVKCTAPKNN